MRRSESWPCRQSNNEKTLSRDLADRVKFIPPDLRVGESVFHWQEDPSKIQQGRKSGKWLKVEILAVKGPMADVSTGASIFHENVNKLRRPLGTGFGRISGFE